MTEKTDPTRYALRNAGHIESCFDLFCRGSILEKICEWTNKVGTMQKGTHWREIDNPEQKKRWGCCCSLVSANKKMNLSSYCGTQIMVDCFQQCNIMKPFPGNFADVEVR